MTTIPLMPDAENGATQPTRTDTAVKAALNLVPWVGGSLAVLYEDVLARRRSRLDAFADAAFGTYPGSAEALIGRMKGDSRIAELFLQSAEASIRTSVDAKAVALGRILADAATATSEDEIDKDELLSLALVDTELPHVRGLAALAVYPSDSELYAEHGRDEHERINSDERRIARLQAVKSTPAPVLSALVRHGLVGQESGYSLYIDGVTDFGRELLAYLEDQAGSADDAAQELHY
jgi:hypothetical protein